MVKMSSVHFLENNMKRMLAPLGAVALSFGLSGCLQPTAHSMGATLMPAPLQHRADGNSENSELAVSVSGFYAHTSEDDNVKDMNAGGGNLSVTYRLGGTVSPLFVNAAVGGFAGSLNFACTDDCDWEKYDKWLDSKEGKADYSFWNLQERVVAGADFNPGPFLIVGLAGGVQLYQGSSDYDDKRHELDGEGLVDDVDGKFGAAPVSVLWLGSHLGRNGQYGNVVFEASQYYKGDIDDWSYSNKLTYSHPSGFFGGVAEGNLMDLTLFAGKTFVF